MGEDALRALLGRQQLQALLGRQLYVEGHPVRIIPRPLDEQPVGVRNPFEVNIAVELIHLPQLNHRLQEPFHRIVRALFDGGGEKEPFDVVALVEVHHQLADLVRRRGSARHVVRRAVDAVQAVIGAFVAHQNFQQGDAPPVRRERVTDSGIAGIPRPAAAVAPVRTRRRTGYVEFSGIRENFQPFRIDHAAALLVVCVPILARLFRKVKQMFVFFKK